MSSSPRLPNDRELQPEPARSSCWQQLFRGEDYRFQMGVRQQTPGQFYAATPNHTAILTERARWLEDAPEEYAVLNADGNEPLEEFQELMRRWGVLSANASDATTPAARCRELARRCEPDFLLLRLDEQDRFRLAGGSVCFPSSWALREKMALPVSEIHDVVPGLNSALGRQIQTFLSRLTPDISWERENWGLAADAELNRHPRRGLAGLTSPRSLAEVWLRVEYQSFVSLPKSRGILFGIRVQAHCLTEVARDPAAAHGLVRALRTMPAAVAAYKGLALARTRLIELLSAVV